MTMVDTVPTPGDGRRLQPERRIFMIPRPRSPIPASTPPAREQYQPAVRPAVSIQRRAQRDPPDRIGKAPPPCSTSTHRNRTLWTWAA
jgi:hypothetical protein